MAQALLTGVFAVKEVNDIFSGKPVGLLEGNGAQVLNQLAAVATAWVIAIVGTWVILKICDATVGVRVTELEEQEGLDFSLHGEEGYNLDA